MHDRLYDSVRGNAELAGSLVRDKKHYVGAGLRLHECFGSIPPRCLVMQIHVWPTHTEFRLRRLLEAS